MTAPTDTLGNAALDLVSRGFAVLPLHSPTDDGCTCSRGASCTSPGKHPRTAHGVHDATDDPWQVAEWWQRWPSANIGARVPEGCAVIDVDPRSGGERTLAAMVAEYGPLPTTLVAETGGGGTHVWVRHPGPVVGKLGPGVDVKGPSGYLVMPPSEHASGFFYRWATPAGLAPAPAGYLEHMQALAVPRQRNRRARRR